MKTLYALSILSLAFAFTGCDDDDDSSAITINSGLPDDKKISELSQEEAEQLCGASAEGTNVEELVPQSKSCTMMGLFMGETEQACQAVEQECLKNPQPVSEDDEDEDEDEDEDDCELRDAAKRANCEATVGEAEACAAEAGNALISLLNAQSCADAGKPDSLFAMLFSSDGQQQINDYIVARAPSCQSAVAKCPGFMGSEIPDGGVETPDSGAVDSGAVDSGAVDSADAGAPASK